MSTQLYGIDVSHYQSAAAPGGVPWSVLKQGGCAFAFVRATYGTFRDERAVSHVRAARAVGMSVTLYHFFRHNQPVTDQLAAFCAQALACGVRVGDIAPAVDIEDDGAPVSPAWESAANALTAGIVANFGDCIIYGTQRGFGMMGKPAWWLERPLWVAHYTGSAAPATPGNKPWTIWQHRVGPWVFDGQGGAFTPDGKPWKAGGPAPGPLDQSRAVSLPLCTRVPGATGSTPPPPDGPAPDHSHEYLVAARLAAFTADLDVAGHAARDIEDDERDTDPAPPLDPEEPQS